MSTVILYGEVSKLPVAKRRDWPSLGRAVRQSDSFAMQMSRKRSELPPARVGLSNYDGLCFDPVVRQSSQGNDSENPLV